MPRPPRKAAWVVLLAPLMLPLAWQASPAPLSAPGGHVALPAQGGIGLPLPLETATCFLGATGFEPTLGWDASGTLFYGGLRVNPLPPVAAEEPDTPGGFSSTPFIQTVYRSTDGCRSWDDVTPTTDRLPLLPAIGSERPLPPMSFDPYLTVDERTGRVFGSNLQGAFVGTGQCSWLSFTDDQGASWTHNPIGCGLPPGVNDHQTVFTGPMRVNGEVFRPISPAYPDAVYYCVNRNVDSACAASLDGGVSFGPPMRAFETATCGGAANLDGLHGHGTTDADGRVYLPRAACGVPQLAISDDMGLTWRVSIVNETALLGKNQGGRWDHEVSVAVDASGTVYAFWLTGVGHPQYASSADHGETWGPARNVSFPGLARGILPAFAAGAKGRIAWAFVGEAPAAPGEWQAYLGVALDADTDHPSFDTAIANVGHAIAHGHCSEAPKFCEIGDFLDIQIGPDGRPWAAFVDQGGSFGRGYGLGFVATLDAGPALRGPLAPLPPR